MNRRELVDLECEQDGCAPRGTAARTAVGDTHPEITAAGGARGDALADAGYDVVEAQPPLYEAALDVWGRLLSIDIRAQEPVLRQILGADAIRGAPAAVDENTLRRVRSVTLR